MTSFRQDSDSRGGGSSSTRPQKRKYLLTNFHMFLLSFIDVHTQTQTTPTEQPSMNTLTHFVLASGEC